MAAVEIAIAPPSAVLPLRSGSYSVDARPALPVSSGSRSLWDRAAEIRDQTAEAIENHFERRGIRAWVRKSKPGEYPPFVAVDSWLPVGETDVAKIVDKSGLTITISVEPYRESPILFKAELRRHAKHFSAEYWRMPAEELQEMVGYLLDGGKRPRFFSERVPLLLRIIGAFIPFVGSDEKNKLIRSARPRFWTAPTAVFLGSLTVASLILLNSGGQRTGPLRRPDVAIRLGRVGRRRGNSGRFSDGLAPSSCTGDSEAIATLAIPASLQDPAVDVLRYAREIGCEIVYRIELRTRPADVGLARRLIPALAAISRNGRHPELEGALREAVEWVSRDGWAAHESFMLPADANSSWLENLVLHRLRTGTRSLPSDFWTLLHGSPGTSAGAAAMVQITRDMAFPDRLLDAIVPSTEDGAALALRPRSSSPSSAGDYAFVSYAHANRDYGQKVIALLQAAGVRVWFDAGIKPGTVWDETLEARIRDAGAIVVCLTANYEGSRYCTRELKFADFLGKPILPIALTPWVWGAGLQLMFQELQVASFGQGEGFVALREALWEVAPRVFQ
ncbi:MAG TPA: toll/interleukin-1 receptor domain-containing protein [Burkholderiaceae bacterium]|nr:toll/interleukin-1 receptor domain-containing protein [Burkholderiaceae bacterium]